MVRRSNGAIQECQAAADERGLEADGLQGLSLCGVQVA